MTMAHDPVPMARATARGDVKQSAMPVQESLIPPGGGPNPSAGGPGTFDYDSISQGYYDEVYRRRRGVQSKWHHLKFSRFRRELAAYRRHLDIGCGPGTFIGSLGAEHQSTGIDIASGQITYARAHYAGAGRDFTVVETGPLPCAEGSFDAVTLIELIEHLPEEENLALLREALRVLRPGGKLLVSTPNYGGAWPLVEALVNRFGETSYAEQHITRYDRRALRELMARAGGEGVAVRAYMGIAPFSAFLGWGVADLVSRLEPAFLTNAYGLLLFATARKAR
jgi:2-polyprenyl-3-methyl-5-hydroxy-6-metoxy-1,4-benzoquinol methylase